MIGNKILIFLMFISMSSCSGSDNPPIKQSLANGYKVSFLFEIDGCRVYRFVDYGREIYFVNKEGSVSWDQLEGKINCPKRVETK